MTVEEYNSLGKEIESLLILRYSPIALKLLYSEDEIPEGTLRPCKDRGDRLAMCQAYAMVRRNRKAITMLKEDHWCVWPLVSYGMVDLDEDEPDEDKLRALKQKALRRSGLVSDDLTLLQAMEHGLADDGRFLPVKLKAPKPTKKNPDPAPELSAASAVADLEKFGRLARFAQGKLLEMGRELKKGRIDAAPCRHGQSLQCDWCEFRAACRFDETLGDRIRSLANLKDSEFWEKLAEGGQAHAPMDRGTEGRD